MNKHHVGVLVEKNAFQDDGEGIVTFPNGLSITDDSIQRNGTAYDITTLNLDEFNGHLTADHESKLSHIIGKVEGVRKVGNKVVVDKIKYFVNENPYALLAYNLLKASKTIDFSTETYGPTPDEQGVYYNSSVVGLSQVVVGNNKSATVNEIVFNSIKEAKENGLDTKEIEDKFSKQFRVETNHQETSNNNNKEKDSMKFVTIKNSREFAVVAKYKNAAGEDAEQKLAPGSTIDVEEAQKEAVEKQIADAKAPEVKKKKVEKVEKDENNLAELIANALKPVTEKIDEIEKNSFDKNAIVPEFKKAQDTIRSTAKNEFSSMNWQDRHAQQINSAWDLLKRGDKDAAATLNAINEVNLDELKKEGLVRNSVTIGDFGNFIISREMLTEIEGQRNDYSSLVNATNWKETLSTQMAWITRSGDISMEEVEFCDDGSDGNLKPISEYGATVETANLQELAAVTPVCNAATRFLAVDLLGDVAAGYRNDYDRKRAQLVIARLEQAVEGNGNSVIYDTNPSVEALEALLSAYARIAQNTPNGTFIMNTTSYASILGYALRAGVQGPLSSIFTTGDQPRMFGRPYLIVSNDLLPSLDSAGTVTIQVEGANVVVNHAVFYADLSKFTGRTSGGLQYDLSTEAAYEDGGTVKSAYQRNELVLRGSFFRGGAITDETKVSGILSPGVS